MADYIKRDAVLAKAYWHGDSCTQSNPYPDGVEAVDVSAIEQLPAANVVEVVRCLDCRDYNKTGCDPGFGECAALDYRLVQECFFCAHGERRTDNA